MPLATMHLSLRETCPKRGEGAGERGVTIGGPEAHEVLRFAILNAPQLELRRRLWGDALRLCERRAQVLAGDGIGGGKGEPRPDPPRRKAREVHDRRRHEGAVGHDDLTTVAGP